jgi:hypothetical protein
MVAEEGLGAILSLDLTTFLRKDLIGLLISSRLRLRPQATVVCPKAGSSALEIVEV